MDFLEAAFCVFYGVPIDAQNLFHSLFNLRFFPIMLASAAHFLQGGSRAETCKISEKQPLIPF